MAKPEYRPSALERAFTLADMGLPISDIRFALSREGYDWHQLEGVALAKQLRERAKASQRQG